MSKNPLHFVILHLTAPNGRDGNPRRCYLVLDASQPYASPVYATRDDAGNAAYDCAPWITGDGTRYMTREAVDHALTYEERYAWQKRVQTIETTPGTVARWMKWQKRRDTEAADEAKHAAKLARIEAAPIRDVLEITRDTLLISPAGKAVHRKAGTRFVCSAIIESATAKSSPETAFVNFTCKGARWEAPADAVKITRKAAS